MAVTFGHVCPSPAAGARRIRHGSSYAVAAPLGEHCRGQDEEGGETDGDGPEETRPDHVVLDGAVERGAMSSGQPCGRRTPGYRGGGEAAMTSDGARTGLIGRRHECLV